MAPTDEEKATAQALAKYLTESKTHYSSSAFGRGEYISPLEHEIRLRVSQMARDIADEAVGGAPGLEQLLRDLTRRTLDQVLKDDAFLRDSVVTAVATAIKQRTTVNDD